MAGFDWFLVLLPVAVLVLPQLLRGPRSLRASAVIVAVIPISAYGLLSPVSVVPRVCLSLACGVALLPACRRLRFGGSLLPAVALATAPVLVLGSLDVRLPSALTDAGGLPGSLAQRALEEALPPAIGGARPTEGGPIALPSSDEVLLAAGRVRESVVDVIAAGCGGANAGTGFVVGPGLVVTSAHLVAGMGEFTVDRHRRYPASPILVDQSLDVALLRVPGLRARPLPFLEAVRPPGTGGALVAFSAAGDLQIQPVAVRRRFNALTADVYGMRAVRPVYELEAVVFPGNSGAPILDLEGRVMGVVFSRSLNRPGIAYAVAAGDLPPLLPEATRSSRAADVGPCPAALLPAGGETRDGA